MNLRNHTLVAALLGLLVTPGVALADTYQFLDLGPDMTNAGQTSVYGITASGAVVLLENFHVGVPQCAISHICTEYETWVNGTEVNDSPTAPNLVYDNGTPCIPTVSFPVFSLGAGVCNNGHEVYSATSTSTPPGTATFDGPDLTDVLASSPVSVDEVNLNASGDFAFDITHPTADSGEIYEAIDLSTTPEPGSIFLLGTGLLTAGIGRRRVFLRKTS